MIRFCSFHNMKCYTVNNCGRFGSTDRIDHLPVLLSNTKSSDCPFGCVIINRNISVREEYPEIFSLVQRISNGITKFVLFGHIYGFQIRKKCIHKRFDNHLPLLQSFFRRKVIQFPFFSINCLNMFHQQKCIGFLLIGFGNQFQSFIKSAATVHPASGSDQFFQLFF